MEFKRRRVHSTSHPSFLKDPPPVAVAFHLCREAGLNVDQMRPVVCIADVMRSAWKKEQNRRAAARSAGEQPKEPRWLIPLCGKLANVRIVGGGGCGKTRIITKVLVVLFTAFWGPRGCLQTAYSNKAARGIGGKTCFKIAKIIPQRTHFLGLRVTDDEGQKARLDDKVPTGGSTYQEGGAWPARPR